MNKRISVGVSAALIIIAVTITFTATMIFSMKLYDKKLIDVKERAALYNTVYELDTLLRENFYTDINDNSMSRGMLSGMIDGLNDKYSSYLTSTQIDALEKNEAGSGLSIGITVAENTDGYIIVKSVIADSAAADEGIEKDDLVTSIDGTSLLTISYEEAEAMLDVAEGENLQLKLNRNGRELTVNIEAEQLNLPVVDSQLYDLTGYIRIIEFNQLTAAQFDDAVNQQILAGITGLIIDLRDCGTGIDVANAADTLDLIVGTGTIVSGTYADGATKVLYTSGAEKIDTPIVVLVNDKTEYLAELFAAVLRDMNDCVIVGERTVGHGTMQSVLRMTTGAGVLLTVCSLNPPTSGSFDGEGIVPDYEVIASDSLIIGESAPSETSDAQFKKAVDVLKGIVVS